MQMRQAAQQRALTRGSSRIARARPVSVRSVAPSTISDVEQAANPMNLVFVAAEVAPWSKTGGLGDVVGGLPIELAKRGHHVMTIAPRYDQYADAWDTSVVVNIDGEDVRYFHSVKKGVHRVFVDHPWFLAKVWGKTGAKLYGGKSGSDYLDNHKRFALFCRAALEASRALPFGGGEDAVFVANDWHAALLPLLLKDVYQPRGEFVNAKSALCIHNIAFQGRFWPETFSDLGLPDAALAKLAFTDGYDRVFNENEPLDDEDGSPLGVPGTYPKINWLKGGILAADKVLTVSPNYASEISTSPSGGVELDDVIRKVGGAEGIVNGMDLEEWDPSVDKFLALNYDQNNVHQGKAAAKAQLQAELGLEVDPSVPLFGYIGRLEEQKGVDILIKALPQIASEGAVQIALLGTGKAKFETAVKALNKLPGVKGVVKFSAPLAHLITAGADFIVVPSRFEPCGLIQLHAMHYGTVPLVSSTGGLVDTVKEGVTGFHMGAFDKDGLVAADAEAVAATVSRAAAAYRSGKWQSMAQAAIDQDLSWAKPAKKWEAVLEEIMTGVTSAKKDAIVTPVQEPGPQVKTLSSAAIAKASGAAPAPAAGPAPAAAPAAAAPAIKPAAAAAARAAAAATPAVPRAAPAPVAAAPAQPAAPAAPAAPVAPKPAAPAAAAVTAPKPAAPAAAAPKPAAAAAAPAAVKAAASKADK
ncbi:MAG: granule-bound starch synthase I [Monoraphidium minutum]|nr:MAG: granule-bound starch synthase I [Monoraphidium minutum]